MKVEHENGQEIVRIGERKCLKEINSKKKHLREGNSFSFVLAFLSLQKLFFVHFFMQETFCALDISS